MSDDRPVGVFDSGVGGLTLLRELDSFMPYEDYIYLADTARMPYGTRTEEEIVEYSEQLIHFLERQDCKMIVIACNTVSGLIPQIEKDIESNVPVVGIINYGCVAAALYVTYNFRIGVWATQRTIDSQVYRKFMDNFDPTVRILTESCSELIPLIEGGKVGSPEMRRLAEMSLGPMVEADIDTIILGCTHLPFIKAIIQDILTPAVTIIDPAKRTAVLCNKTLKDNQISRENHCSAGTKKFYVTGDAEAFLKTSRLVAGDMAGHVEAVDVGQ